MAKLPLPPPAAELAAVERDDVVAVHDRSVLWRISATVGEHVTPPMRLRTWGPASGRFDPHPPPPGEHPSEGVLYLATEIDTAVAETFQERRTIDRLAGAPYLLGLRLRRPVRLLDLSGTWPTRAGASQAIGSGPRPRARAWARTIRAANPDLDGVWWPSSMRGGGHCLALWWPARDALPADPELFLPLSHPALYDPLALVAKKVGYLLD